MLTQHNALTRMQGASHVVLVGDHFQLPPVVQSQEAAAKGLDLSLFERFMQQGVPSALLQVWFRGSSHRQFSQVDTKSQYVPQADSACCKPTECLTRLHGIVSLAGAFHVHLSVLITHTRTRAHHNHIYNSCVGLSDYAGPVGLSDYD